MYIPRLSTDGTTILISASPVRNNIVYVVSPKIEIEYFCATLTTELKVAKMQVSKNFNICQDICDRLWENWAFGKITKLEI